MTLRLRLVLPARRLPARRLIIVAAGIACLIAASATAAWVGYLRPYRDGDARPIAARATFDYDQGTSELTLECPMSIREYTLTSGGTARRIGTRARRASIPLAPPLPPLAVTSSGSAFLDRRNVVVELSPAPGTSLRPYRVTLRLVSGAEFVLFDSSFPFVRDPSGREYAIRIGSSPPFPLRVELTLPRGLDVDLRVSAEYLEFPSDLGVLSPGAVVEPRMEIRFVHPIRT